MFTIEIHKLLRQTTQGTFIFLDLLFSNSMFHFYVNFEDEDKSMSLARILSETSPNPIQSKNSAANVTLNSDIVVT